MMGEVEKGGGAVVLLHAILADGEARRKESQGRALPFIRPSAMLIMPPLQHALITIASPFDTSGHDGLDLFVSRPPFLPAEAAPRCPTTALAR